MVGAATRRHTAGEGVAIMPRKQHSIAFQDEACKLVSEQGYSQEKAAAQLGITSVTLRAWLKKRRLLEPVDLVEPDSAPAEGPKRPKPRIGGPENRLKGSGAVKAM